MQEHLLIVLGVVALLGLFILYMVIEENIFGGIMALFLWPFLRKRKKNHDDKD